MGAVDGVLAVLARLASGFPSQRAPFAEGTCAGTPFAQIVVQIMVALHARSLLSVLNLDESGACWRVTSDGGRSGKLTSSIRGRTPFFHSAVRRPSLPHSGLTPCARRLLFPSLARAYATFVEP